MRSTAVADGEDDNEMRFTRLVQGTCWLDVTEATCGKRASSCRRVSCESPVSSGTFSITSRGAAAVSRPKRSSRLFCSCTMLKAISKNAANVNCTPTSKAVRDRGPARTAAARRTCAGCTRDSTNAG